MKKAVVVLSTLFIALFLTACLANDGDTTDKEKSDSTEEKSEDVKDDTDNAADDEEDKSADTDKEGDAENQEDMKKLMEALDFTKLEIEISYGKDKEYEAEIEHHHNGDIEAEVEDEINGVDIDDDVDAFNYIYPNAKKLDIDRGMEKQDLIDQVLEAFDLKDDYEKFEVEFTFEDGTKLSVEDKK